jgi:hypothetical protein
VPNRAARRAKANPEPKKVVALRAAREVLKSLPRGSYSSDKLYERIYAGCNGSRLPTGQRNPIYDFVLAAFHRSVINGGIVGPVTRDWSACIEDALQWIEEELNKRKGDRHG